MVSLVCRDCVYGFLSIKRAGRSTPKIKSESETVYDASTLWSPPDFNDLPPTIREISSGMEKN
jgi:hypothetical protein